MDKEFGKILSTYEYDKFKKIKGNRKINFKNLGKIINSMSKKQLVIPILVNEKFEVIDGQHRLQACIELGLPVYYYIVEGYGDCEVITTNLNQENWTKSQFLDYYIDHENHNYILFEEIRRNNGLNINQLLNILAKVKNVTFKSLSFSFVEGTFRLSQEDVWQATNFLTCLQDFSKYKYYKSDSFVLAFLCLYHYQPYDHSHIIEQLKIRGDKLNIYASKGEYLRILTTEIYSNHKGKKTIYYDTFTKKFYT